jgi:hypothetical protein
MDNDSYTNLLLNIKIIIMKLLEKLNQFEIENASLDKVVGGYAPLEGTTQTTSAHICTGNYYDYAVYTQDDNGNALETCISASTTP